MTDSSSAEIVAHCSPLQDGLAAPALSGEATALYRPLVVGGELGGPAIHDRDEVAEALSPINRRWNHPRAEELVRTVADRQSRVVVTGQQPGIFGGPLLTLVKALTASLWAEKLSAEGTPAVAVFWIAGEDHDYREVAETSWLAGNDLRHEILGQDDSPLVPVGRRPLGGAVDVLLAQWADSQPTDFWRTEAARLARHFAADATFTEAFASYLVDVLGERCPLLLDAQDPDIKRLQQPWLERLVDRRDDLEEMLRQREQAIQDAGFELQVPSRPHTAPLFLHDEGLRRRVLWRGDGFALEADEPVRPLAELQQVLTQTPENVSPSALSRPPIQDALLGTNLFVVGPGELAYLAQSAPIYELFELTPPSLVVRPSIALAARRKLEQALEIGLPLEDLAADGFDAEGFLAGRVGSNPVPATARTIRETLTDLQKQLLEIDPTMEQPWAKTRGNIEQALERLESKVDRSLAERDQVTANRVEELEILLTPGRRPQERALSTAWALGRFGGDLPEKLAGVLDLTPGRMQVIAV